MSPPNAPADRITPDHVHAYAKHLGDEVRLASIAQYIHSLYYAARLIAPNRDWTWLRKLEVRIASRAQPQDRSDRLVPPWSIFDLGVELMTGPVLAPTLPQKRQMMRYRDGLILALLSLWPVRRRSIEIMSVHRNVEIHDQHINLVLRPDDTKSRRFESFRLPAELVPYFHRYLDEIRPCLLEGSKHDGLWPSLYGPPLVGRGFFRIVRSRIFKKFGKAMSPHDIRRSATTFLSMHAPDRFDIAQAALQHAGPHLTRTSYNFSRSNLASKRHAELVQRLRQQVRPAIAFRSTPQPAVGELPDLTIACIMSDEKVIQLFCSHCRYNCRIDPAWYDITADTPVKNATKSMRCPNCRRYRIVARAESV